MTQSKLERPLPHHLRRPCAKYGKPRDRHQRRPDRHGVRRSSPAGKTFAEALDTRTFEPDAPNFTPRISGMLHLSGAAILRYRMNILKSGDPLGTACVRRQFLRIPRCPALGHFLHTYRCRRQPHSHLSGRAGAGLRFADDIERCSPGKSGRAWMRKTGFPCTPVIPTWSPGEYEEPI